MGACTVPKIRSAVMSPVIPWFALRFRSPTGPVLVIGPLTHCTVWIEPPSPTSEIPWMIDVFWPKTNFDPGWIATGTVAMTEALVGKPSAAAFGSLANWSKNRTSLASNRPKLSVGMYKVTA